MVAGFEHNTDETLADYKKNRKYLYIWNVPCFHQAAVVKKLDKFPASLELTISATLVDSGKYAPHEETGMMGAAG